MPSQPKPPPRPPIPHPRRRPTTAPTSSPRSSATASPTARSPSPSPPGTTCKPGSARSPAPSSRNPSHGPIRLRRRLPVRHARRRQSHPDPLRALQDVGVDFCFDTKLLYGSSQFALEQARGKAKIEIKAAVGRVDPNLFNNIFFGLATATGESLNSIDEAGDASAGTFTVANGATFSQDLGLYNTVTGLWMTRVASSPAAGQYAVNTAPASTPSTPPTTADAAGSATPTLRPGPGQPRLHQPAHGRQRDLLGELVNKFRAWTASSVLFMNFPAVQARSCRMPLKLDDFTLPQLDMSAQDNGTGNVFYYSMTG